MHSPGWTTAVVPGRSRKRNPRSPDSRANDPWIPYLERGQLVRPFRRSMSRPQAPGSLQKECPVLSAWAFRSLLRQVSAHVKHMYLGFNSVEARSAGFCLSAVSSDLGWGASALCALIKEALNCSATPGSCPSWVARCSGTNGQRSGHTCTRVLRGACIPQPNSDSERSDTEMTLAMATGGMDESESGTGPIRKNCAED